VPCRVMARLAYTWLMDMCDIWDSRFAERSPMFEPLRPLALALAGDTWPAPERLNELALELGVVSGGGQPLRFVNVTGKDAPKAADYELRIHDEGIVPMRVANWHDFFNAVVWLTFPHIKSALNRGHARELRSNLASTRNRRRDALTLFDESGVLVFSCSREVLDGLRAFAWGRVLRDARNTFQTTTRCLIVGHALYEKALSPYIGMTGHALLLSTGNVMDVNTKAASGSSPGIAHYDMAAQALLAEIVEPRDLSPLPVLGVPGWWEANRDAAFYDNVDYFRAGRTRHPGPSTEPGGNQAGRAEGAG
jgi:hypothetical protein